MHARAPRPPADHLNPPLLPCADQQRAVGTNRRTHPRTLSPTHPGGQGGGSFYIPLFSVLLGFTVNQAAGLSAAVVFFGCVAMVAQAVALPHPNVAGAPQVRA